MKPLEQIESKTKRTDHSYNVIDLLIVLALFVILVLLSANIYVIFLASRSNDLACRDAIDRAFKAINSGKDMDGIMQAAQESLTACGAGNFFIEHPQFSKFRLERLPQASSLTIETFTVARPPAPFLLADNEITHNGTLTITKTYVLHLSSYK